MRKLSVSSSMSRPPKPAAQAKRVAPPAVPEIYRHSGSSFGSAGYGSSEDTNNFLGPPDTPNTLGIKDDLSDYGSVISKSPGVMSNYVAPTAFTFPVPREPLTHKAAVYYHQQLALQEDQGIDLTQSPGRDSPGSSSGSAGSGSRHSTASLDSGRASSYHTQISTRGALSSPRCSVSSCSIGSVDRMTQSSDHEIITEWLRELCFEEYAQLFSAAGYDMPTISRMTPEDLTAIGIKKPHHRERIKHHIDALQMPDNLPNNVPGSIEEWLRLLRLEEYVQPLLAQGYETVRDVIQLPWEDMEDIGIVKLGHQKKLLLAIKRVKDIISGKWPIQGQHCIQSTFGEQQQQHLASQPKLQQQLFHFEQHDWSHAHTKNDENRQQFYHPSIPPHATPSATSNTNQHHQQMAWDHHHSAYPMSQSAFIEKEANNIVLIKLRQQPRGKSLESLEDPSELSIHHHHHHHQGSHLTFSGSSVKYYNCHPSSLGAQFQSDDLQMTWRRSYDDGDITPTNEIGIGGSGGTAGGIGCCDQGGGTLPRHNRSGVPRQRPIAKVMANVVQQQHQQQQQQQQQQQIPKQQSIITSDFANEKLISCSTKCYGMHCQRTSAGGIVCGGGGGGNGNGNTKKHPPEPPKRHCALPMDQLNSHFDGMSLIHHPSYLPLHSSSSQLQQQQHYLVHHVVPQPLYANYAGQTHQTTVEIHAEKIADTKVGSAKSNSSIDSIDAIPFANDNAGTIKQRALNRQEMQSSLSSSSSSSSLATTVASVGGGQSSSLPSMKSVNQSGGTTISNTAAAAVTTTPSPTLSTASSIGVANLNADPATVSVAATANTTTTNTIDSNVLNDIGNMLANLTDELDAMLEEEKRAGLNDSE